MSGCSFALYNELVKHFLGLFGVLLEGGHHVYSDLLDVVLVVVARTHEHLEALSLQLREVERGDVEAHDHLAVADIIIQHVRVQSHVQLVTVLDAVELLLEFFLAAQLVAVVHVDEDRFVVVRNGFVVLRDVGLHLTGAVVAAL